jgi:hypothetical protein
MTYSEEILEILKSEGRATCQRITHQIILSRNLTDNKARYLSGSISSKLRKMVNDGILEYNPIWIGPKGGHVYQIKTK